MKYYMIMILFVLMQAICSSSSKINESVIIKNPQSAFIEPTVTIGEGTVIIGNVYIIGNTTIGKNCHIEPFCVIDNCTIGDNVVIHTHTVLKNVHLKDQTEVGPFAHIKEHSIINEKSVIGNFVEVTRSSIGINTKAKHLTYLGDATLGNNVNVGAGTVTCNYDGFNKNRTIVHDNAFIGSNSSIVAPIELGKRCIVAAGSTITSSVPDDALVIARSGQTNKQGYAEKLFKKYREKKEAQNKS